jgi:hypothetical protein
VDSMMIQPTYRAQEWFYSETGEPFCWSLQGGHHMVHCMATKQWLQAYCTATACLQPSLNTSAMQVHFCSAFLRLH